MSLERGVVTVELRPPRLEDAADLAAAMDEFGRVNEGDRISKAEVETWLGTPSLDVERDARVAVADGKPVGYGDIFNSSREGRVIWSYVGAHPSRLDALPPLLDFVEARAAERASPDGVLKMFAPERADALRNLLESRGFAFENFSLRMAAELDDEPPNPEWPQGIWVRTFRGDEDARAVYKVHQETFSDLRDHSRDSFEDWRHWSLREGLDPELWFLAEADGDLQGVCLCRPSWEGDPNFGWISVIGVRRPWRGRGLGLALLRHSFRELRARGKTRVGLGVDAENATGAVRLYEKAGMEVTSRRLWYRKAVG